MTRGACPAAFVLAVLFLTFSGGASTPPPAATASQEDLLSVDQGTNVTLDLAGTGWGRIVLAATEPVDLRLHVTHDQIPDFHRYDRGGLYDAHTFTFIYLVEPGNDPHDEWYFHWTANPYSEGKPSIGWDPPEWLGVPPATPLHLEPGEEAVLVVADRAGGYHVTVFHDTTSSPSRSVTWTLGANPDLSLTIPQPDVHLSYGDATAGARNRTWTHTAPVPADAAIYAVAWSHSDRDPHEVLVSHRERDHVAFGPEGESWPRPRELRVEQGWGWSDRRVILLGHVDQATETWFYREFTEATLSTATWDAGASFLVVPLGPWQADPTT